MRVGESVTLVNTGNSFIPDGTLAVIAEVTSYGALVKTPATKTGVYRAGFSEIAPSGNNGHARKSPADNSPTGEICSTCGGCNLVRSGTCLCCQDCGSTTGCS